MKYETKRSASNTRTSATWWRIRRRWLALTISRLNSMGRTLGLNVWNVTRAMLARATAAADDFVRIMSLANAILFYLRWTEFMKMNTICTEMNTNILDTQTGILFGGDDDVV